MGLWVIARVDLGLSEEEFWRSTPRGIVRFLERKQEHTKLERMLEDLRFGKVLALIAQIFAKDPTKSTPYEPRDFFPELPAAQKQEQTWQEQLEVMKANSAILGRLR